MALTTTNTALAGDKAGFAPRLVDANGKDWVGESQLIAATAATRVGIIAENCILTLSSGKYLRTADDGVVQAFCIGVRDAQGNPMAKGYLATDEEGWLEVVVLNTDGPFIALRETTTTYTSSMLYQAGSVSALRNSYCQLEDGTDDAGDFLIGGPPNYQINQKADSGTWSATQTGSLGLRVIALNLNGTLIVDADIQAISPYTALTTSTIEYICATTGL